MDWLPVLVFLLGFAGSHIVLTSAPVRGRLVAWLGDRGFQGLFSVVAIATFVPFVWSYWQHKHAGPLLFDLVQIPGVRAFSIALSGLAFVFVVLAFVQPSATAQPFFEHARARAQGVSRITRHPMLVGVGLWGLAHVLANGFLTDVIFFGGLAVYALVGAAHQDSRKRALPGDPLGAYYAETSLLPFAAIAAGRNRLALAEISWPGAAAGAAIAAALFWMHPWLFA